MGRNGKGIEAVLAEAEQIVRVWEANADFKMGEVTLDTMKTSVSALRALRDKVEDRRTELTALLNQLHDDAKQLSKISTRARAGFRATYGPDSSQYEQAGGTRESERKRTGRKSGGTKQGSA